jgi:hypothetical protein
VVDDDVPELDAGVLDDDAAEEVEALDDDDSPLLPLLDSLFFALP